MSELSFPHLPGEAKPGDYEAITGDKIRTNASYAVFPIVRQDTVGRMHLLGTGFFITTNGVFVTARHVLMHVLDSRRQQTQPIGLFQLLDNEGNFLLRPILRSVSQSAIRDVARILRSTAWMRDIGHIP